jgi:hypothetical protein
MKALGIILFLLACMLGGAVLNMDTSVETGFGRVNNIGLMQEKQNYLIVSGVLAVLGIILMVAAKPKQKPEKAKYLEFLDIANREDYKGNNKEAIDAYLDALYLLETDNKSYSRKKLQAKEDLINTVKEKVAALKAKTTV